MLIDNASDDGTKEYLEDLKRRSSISVELIRNETNLGFVKAVNQGLHISNSPYVCVLNNDTLPGPGWLEHMVDFAANNKDIGLINPVCDGHGENSIESYAKSLEKNKGKYMEMNQCQGFCMLIKRELIDKIGYLDESFGIGGYDDTDYSIRAHKAGYRSVAIYDAYVYHRLHASFDKAGNREEWVKKNKRIYYDKWGKHLRVGIPFSLDDFDTSAISRVVTFAYGLAREWSWVHIWINFKRDKNIIKSSIEECLRLNNLPPHQNIRIDYFRLPKWLFNIAISGKLVERVRKRMQDKRFDAIIPLDEMDVKFFSPLARICDTSVLKASFDGKARNAEQEGRNTALFIKERRDKHGNNAS